MTATYSGEFLGCKVSRTDLEVLRERLAAEGLEEVASAGDVHVVNGCCVTREAVRKTRQSVRQALARSADGVVVVTGCAANLPGEALADLGPRVHVVRGPAERAPATVVDLLRGLGCRGGRPRDAAAARVRAFLRVQDGCSFRCAFCVIPQVRGATRSRPLDEVVAEAERRIAAGHRELVVTGVNVGLYRDRTAGVRLPGLLERLGRVEGLERLRLSSIEVDHVDDALVAALARTPAWLPHLHVPLQSGSDDVLRRMRRRYGRERYLARVQRAREALGDVQVTADVIVGYPGETDDDFAATLDVVERAGLARVHAFPYSPRPGTATEGADDVPPAVKRHRSAAVRALAERQGGARRAARLGQRDRVLVERRDGSGALLGYGRDYTPWRVAGAAEPGEIVDVVAVAASADGLEGRIA